ncbi:MAG: hypothetical protein ACTHK2_11290 [Dokdonella sp.]|uniref:hypothetical protein n=1 Tax=Dokdonella sp. TaxID=2291710 RepID=UPI003F82111F
MSSRTSAKILSASLVLIGGSAWGSGSGEESFAALRAEVQRLRPSAPPKQITELSESTKNLTVCESAPLLVQNGDRAQYIFNEVYSWSILKTPGGFCVHLVEPVYRPLSIQEATDLLAASKTQFQTIEPRAPASENSEPKMGRGFSSEVEMTLENGTPIEKKKEEVIAARVDNRVPINSAAAPFNSVSLVVNDGGNGSAIQVSPYVFMTAAHVVVSNSGAEYTNGAVYPGYNMPVPTNPINVADVTYDASYPSAASSGLVDRFAHDVGFMRISVAHPLPSYPVLYLIRSAADSVSGPGNPCAFGSAATDPFVRGGSPPTWYNGLLLDTCLIQTHAETYTVGYPDEVRGLPNVHPTSAYIDYAAYIAGNRIANSQGVTYVFSLFHTCAGCTLFLGLSTTISVGDSGGPVFGKYGNDWVVLGVNSAATDLSYQPEVGGFSAGRFDYNDSFVISNLGWTPSNPITISSPTSGLTYDRDLVPNLVADAGSLTSQIRWDSNLDGYLGTGGNISIAGRLTTGLHTITASVPNSISEHSPSSVQSNVQSIVKTISLNITTGGVNQPRVSASPNPVVVRFGGTQSNVSVTWTAVSDQSNWRTDVSYHVNGGARVNWKSDVPAGSDILPIRLGDSIKIYAYQHHYGETNANSVTITTVSGHMPTISATPTTVQIPSGSNAGSFVLRWDAPGYTSVDIQGRINGGAWLTPVWAQPTGNSTEGIPLGSTYDYRLYEHGNTSTILATASVQGLAAPAATFTASPAHVIVTSGTDGPTVLTWNAPGYANLDWWGKVNSGPWQGGGLISAGAGSTTERIPAGSTYGYRLYAHGSPNQGGTAGLLAELFVDSVAAAPTFSVTPTHVVVPAGQTAGPATIRWNAPGYTGLDWWGKVNNGPWLGGVLSTPANDSTIVSVPLNTRYSYRFYPHGSSPQGGTVNLLGELTVDAAAQ